MENEYVWINPHYNRDLISHYLQYALYSFLLTMKTVFMLSYFIQNAETSVTKFNGTSEIL